MRRALWVLRFTSMTNVFQTLLLVIADATQKELARQVKYLKVESHGDGWPRSRSRRRPRPPRSLKGSRNTTFCRES